VTAVTARPDTDHPVRAFVRVRRWELLGAIAFVTFVALPFLRRSHLVGGLDTYSYSTPNDSVTFDALRALRLPQWNPFIFGGVAHLANPQVALFNPLKLPFVGLEPWRAVMLITALHLLVLTVGMVVLAHRVRLRPPAGLVAAIAVAGSGMVATKSMQYPQITVLAGVPWLLTTIDLALDRPPRPRRAVAWLAMATAFVCVAGHPQMTFLALALGAAWALSRVLRHDTWRDLWQVAAGVALGAALAAAQLLPTLALLSGAATHDTAALSGNPAYTLDHHRLAVTVLGDVWSKHPIELSGSGETASYVGVVVAVIALFGVVDTLRRRRERAATVVLLLTGAAAFLLAAGRSSPLYRVARDVVPLFDQARVPARWTVVATFVLAILAAMGTDAAMARRIDRRTTIRVVASALVVLVLVAVEVLDAPNAGVVLTWVVVATASIGALVVVSRGDRRWSTGATVLLLVLLVVELGVMTTHSPARTSSVPATYAATTGPAVDYLQAHPKGRVVAMTQDRLGDVPYLLESLRPNVNASRHLRSVDGYDGGPQVRETWLQLVTALTKGRVNPELTLRAQSVQLPLDPERWARYGVRYALIDDSVVPIDQFVPGWRPVVRTDGPLQLFENPSWNGDASVYRATRRVARDPGRVVRTMTDDELRDVALVGPHGPMIECSSDCTGRRARVDRDTAEHLVVHASDDEPSLLALTEQWADGWSVQIDGRDADLVQVDGYMLGVELPRGTHTVAFRYRAPGLRAGLVVSLLAAIAVVVLLVTGRRRTREPARPAA
jgi:hypothetical protein